ncbi:16S rRNA (uracil(1498)-N(3))-methyltransferase [Luteolibacter algae]|uniref:Ribosomal RNA small subunit methyltransferase E n=1 Tax=Luteolibacter algae TaxID=454151 RepID=A0ABW5DA34_9BACT
MPRFHLPPEQWTETPFLDGTEAKHLAQVLRIQPGQTITVFDGRGSRAEAKVLSVSKQRVDLMLELAESHDTPLPEITLAQAIPKGKNMEWIVQKAVELGVSKIQPLVTRHTIVSPGDDKAEKWRRIALEACKQCGQDTIPIIEDPLDFTQWIANQDTAELKILASLAENPKNFRETLQSHPDLEAITVAIGPEGDFSEDETTAAIAAGFIPVTLGNLVLRVETATMLCLSAIRFQYI